MNVAELMNDLPFTQHMGIEVLRAEDGEAVGELTLEREQTTVPDAPVAHGGVAYALADTVGGAAVISLHHRPTPTVDMRIDYHAPATGDLRAGAEVVRNGGSVATACTPPAPAACSRPAATGLACGTADDRRSDLQTPGSRALITTAAVWRPA